MNKKMSNFSTTLSNGIDISVFTTYDAFAQAFNDALHTIYPEMTPYKQRAMRSEGWVRFSGDPRKYEVTAEYRRMFALILKADKEFSRAYVATQRLRNLFDGNERVEKNFDKDIHEMRQLLDVIDRFFDAYKEYITDRWTPYYETVRRMKKHVVSK